jgi:hypothetical protein
MMRPNSETTSVRLPRFSLACAAALAAALIGSGSPARAGFTTYFGIDQGDGTPPTTPVNSLAARTSFISALSGVGVENFEDQTVGAFPSKFNFAPTTVTATSTTTDPSGNYVTTGTPNGAFATSGSNFLYTPGTGSTFLNVNLTFSTPIAGFGLYATDLRATGDLLQYSVTFTNNSTQMVQMNATSESDSSNVLFYGVIETDPSLLIKSLTITSSNPNADGLGDAFGIDDVTMGVSVVPEPASLGMVALGLGAVLLAHRSSRRHGCRLKK